MKSRMLAATVSIFLAASLAASGSITASITTGARAFEVKEETRENQEPKEGAAGKSSQGKSVDLAGISGAEVRLDRIIYPAGSTVSATVSVDSGPLSKENLLLAVASSETKDVELITLKPTSDGRKYVTEKALPIDVTEGGSAQQQDGRLSAHPNEKFFAIFYFYKSDPNEPQGKKPSMAADFGIIEDKNFKDSSVRLVPEIAMTDDEKKVPSGGKRIGTVATRDGGMVQLPVDELVFYPRNQEQLKQFLEETEGHIVMNDALPNQKSGPAKAWLVQVNPEKADPAHLPQMRALFGEKETLYASSKDVLNIYSLAMMCLLEGYAVGVNPRLQFMGGPRSQDDTTVQAIDTVPSAHSSLGLFSDDTFGVPKAWAFLALWDKDRASIPVAILDMGFAPNFDFRGFSDGSMRECNLEDRGALDVRCRPGQAAAPPTVGASFFGDRIWHGNGVVTTAAGILNNGWGSAGTGGQVAAPMLYKTGLRSYAFEMGLGIRRAVVDGAAVINISAGYPCIVIATIAGVTGGIDVCSSGTWASLCGNLATALHLATSVICALPLPPPLNLIACTTASAADATTIAACYTFAIAIPVLTRGLLSDAVGFAAGSGVPVVSISGNVVQNTTGTSLLCSLISCTTQDVSAWQVIPGVLPGVICVGASDDRSPFANNQFFGDEVDLWAPKGGTFFSPPTPDRDDGPSSHMAVTGFSGGSAAAPYIAGIIAMMMAVNPTLNPTITPSARNAANVDRILTLLKGSATPAASLPIDASNPEVAHRRNLINAIGAVRAAAAGTLPDLSGLGYDTSLGFDETDDPSQAFDTQATAKIVRTTAGSIHAGTILTIPRGEGPGGVDFTDQDWFRLITPPEPGVYEISFRLRYPEGFGDLFVRDDRGVGMTPASRSLVGVERVLEYSTPSTFNNEGFSIEVRGVRGADGIVADNVYKLEVLGARRTADAPTPDEFDDPRRSPVDNNAPGRAVPLGGGRFPWPAPTSPPTGDPLVLTRSEIVIPDLNFSHPRGLDQDWFSLTPPSDYQRGPCGACSPAIRISAAPGVSVTVIGSDGRVIRGPSNSPLALNCGEYNGRFPLRFMLTSNGRPINYDLHVSWEIFGPAICDPQGVFRLPLDLSAYIEWLRGHGFVDALREFDPATLDLAGRVVTPQRYFIDWRGDGAFRLLGRVDRGESAALQLLNSNGQPVAQAATADLLLQFQQAVKPVERGDHTDLMIEKNLSKGLYVLSISHRRPGSAIELALTKNATTDGSLSLEELLQFRSKENIASDSVARESRVTSATLVATPEVFSGPCPAVIRFDGNITVNGPGIVRYTFTRSDGATGPVHTLTFKEEGVQHVSTTWTLGDARVLPSFGEWESIKILSPNEMESQQARFKGSCPGGPQPSGVQSPGKRPDLVTGLLGVPPASRPGEDIGPFIKVVGKNIGSASAPGTSGTLAPASGYLIDLRLSTDERVPRGLAIVSHTFVEDMLLAGGRVSNTQDLNPLEGATYPVGALIPADTPAGRYFICARIDPGDTVAELNEENNVACVPIKVKKKASQNLAAVAPLFTAR